MTPLKIASGVALTYWVILATAAAAAELVLIKLKEDAGEPENDTSNSIVVNKQVSKYE